MSHCITQAKSAVGCFVKNKPQSNRLVTKSRPLILMDCFLSVLTPLHTESDRVCQNFFPPSDISIPQRHTLSKIGEEVAWRRWHEVTLSIYKV